MSNYPDGMDGSHPHFCEPDEVEPEVIDPEADADVVRRMAVAQAVFNAVRGEVKTGDEFNLRGEFDAVMAGRFAEAKRLGVAPRSMDVEVGGEKVGTYSFTLTEAAPERTEVALRVEDRAALLAWALRLGYVDIDMKAVEAHFGRTGEVPDGCLAAPARVPAVEGGRVKRTSLRVYPEKVAAALGGELGDEARRLLEGGGGD